MSHIKIHEEAFKFLYLSNNALKKENQRLQKEIKVITNLFYNEQKNRFAIKPELRK